MLGVDTSEMRFQVPLGFGRKNTVTSGTTRSMTCLSRNCCNKSSITRWFLFIDWQTWRAFVAKQCAGRNFSGAPLSLEAFEVVIDYHHLLRKQIQKFSKRNLIINYTNLWIFLMTLKDIADFKTWFLRYSVMSWPYYQRSQTSQLIGKSTVISLNLPIYLFLL